MRDVDELDALGLWIVSNMPVIPSNIGVEDKMRFETVKIENEPINYVYGDIYTIKDNVDDDSPVNTFRLLKPSADKVCKWLNGLVGEEAESFEDEVKNAIEYLWDDDEYFYFVIDDMHIIMEVKGTSISINDVRDALPNAIISYKDIGWHKAIFFIKEDK